MSLFPHLVIDQAFRDKYPCFSDFSYISYKSGQCLFVEPFKVPPMPAHDPTAVAAARDSLRESIDAFVVSLLPPPISTFACG